MLTECFTQALLAAVITYVWIHHLTASVNTEVPPIERQPAVLPIRVPVLPRVGTLHSCYSQLLVLLVSDLSL